MKDIIKIGLIGLGERGIKTLLRYQAIQHAQILGIADLKEERVQQAKDLLVSHGISAQYVYAGEHAWKSLCHSDVDLIYVCTDWASHVQMALYAMEHHKDVAVEVPIATSIDECWQLVECVERTGRKCFMTENCCYDYFSLLTLGLKEQGRLGKITHCEGAYIHNLLDEKTREVHKQSHWMLNDILLKQGNPYPTHGLGPIGWLLDIHRGDRMDYLVSMASFHHAKDEIRGRVNSTLIKTINGASIMLQFDVTTCRPYSRIQTVCGTKGYVQKYPVSMIELENEPIKEGEEAIAYAKNMVASHPLQLWEEGHQKGVANEMNYAMDARLIHCIRHDLPLDIDIYDAVEWSCIAQLTEESVRLGSQPIKIPDFTRGKWKKMSPHHFY